MRRRRRRTRPPQDEDQAVHERAQLHSDGIIPDRKELEGTPASRAMLESRTAELSGLRTKGEVVDTDRLMEMPSNEPAGYEMETTENEIAALDRMARIGDQSTFESSGKTYTGNSDWRSAF